jgi:Na+/citrate or Na+/malate symporter
VSEYNVLLHDGLQRRPKHVSVIMCIMKMFLCSIGETKNIFNRQIGAEKVFFFLPEHFGFLLSQLCHAYSSIIDAVKPQQLMASLNSTCKNK